MTIYNWNHEAIQDWAEWIAMDGDGRVYAYEIRPNYVEINPGWWSRLSHIYSKRSELTRTALLEKMTDARLSLERRPK